MQTTVFQKKLKGLVWATAFILMWEYIGLAEVRLPRVFGSHMVLQREKPIVIWGWADANEKITVSIGEDSREARANERGEWKVTLPPRKAGGPLTLKVNGSSEVVFEDVLIGEV